MKATRILQEIDSETLEAYQNRQITSFEVAKKLGVNAASVRRALKRDPRPYSNPAEERRRLKETRRAFRLSLGHLPLSDVMRLANVKQTTAYKIKEEYARKQKFAPLGPDEARLFGDADDDSDTGGASGSTETDGRASGTLPQD